MTVACAEHAGGVVAAAHRARELPSVAELGLAARLARGDGGVDVLADLLDQLGPPVRPGQTPAPTAGSATEQRNGLAAQRGVTFDFAHADLAIEGREFRSKRSNV